MIPGNSTIVGSGMPSFLTTRIQGVLDIPFSRPATTSVAELIAIATLNPSVWTIFPLNSSKVLGPAGVILKTHDEWDTSADPLASWEADNSEGLEHARLARRLVPDDHSGRELYASLHHLEIPEPVDSI